MGKKVLIIRLSAIGDVAMTIPVIYSAAKANPSDSFTILTQPFLQTLFMNPPPNVKTLGVDTKGTEKSLLGFWKFASKLIADEQGYDMLLDLHSVIRSKILALRFKLSGKPVFVVNKARKERKALTAHPPKTIRPLKPVIERYADVFKNAGFQYQQSFHSVFTNPTTATPEFDNPLITNPKTEKWVGIAPFAKNEGKIYPIHQMEKVVESLSQQSDIHIFLLGAKGNEEKTLTIWQQKYPNVTSLVGKYRLNAELAIIARMDVLVTMDSANMHFASLVDTKVISVWGATHPYAGFYGYRQPAQLAIQVDLDCRPCSIFGNKPCYCGDMACMASINPTLIVNKVMEVLL